MFIHSSYCILIAALTTTAYGFEYRFDDTLRSSAASSSADYKPNLTVAQALGSDDNYCLVFEDHFNTFDLKNWQHEISLSGGGNWEFQYYTNNRSNSFVEDGILYLKPTMTSATIGEEALKNGGRMNLYSGAPSEDCTDNSNYGCERTSGAAADGNYINPIQSARIRTIDSVTLKYGKVEVRARLPTGDWLWPAIWMLPKYSAYGSWPASGEIDILESKGNPKYAHGNTSTIMSTLHWGPNTYQNKYMLTTEQLMAKRGSTWADDFHTYGLEWTKEGLRTYVDDDTILQVDFDKTSWQRGEFTKPTMNPWKGGDISAPFDQEFYLIMNLAVGGVNGYWPEDESKPWQNDDPHAPNAFYNAKKKWLPTWGKGNKRAMAIDWVKMWSTETDTCTSKLKPLKTL
ncbi:hypothetical protein HMPREF1544_01696 [Mucor circinelloides 1006PhL]|uniref:GH16 domain-containing protein n=1 Tax=Mucor circinelloides f. circinelloides (strain 1006PhL) TaxID=1220926 RepID=S2KG61_MUCC1|nr:hypothetical protein HMPREF1544_01696 [Mucor circinelloides 1006PhL]